MIHAWIARLAWPVALAGAIFASGMFYGKYLASADATRMAEKRAAEKAKQGEAVDRIVTEYVDRVITREVIKYVPNNSDCSHASGDFRVFFDSTATDKRLPETAGGADEAAVPFEDIAATIATNHGICHDTADQLKALQAWAREVSK
jgi:hypothetical protein